MKPINLFVSATIALISVFSITAQEIIPVDSTHLLSKKQKKALHIAKHNTFTESGLLNLPLEVNLILNDTTKQYYSVSPLWEKAYYEKNDTAILIIPLKCNDSLEMIQSQLRVIVFANGGYSREVETVIAFEDSSVEQFSGILIYSSIMGELEKIFQFKNGECVDILYNRMLVIDKPQKNKKTNVNLHKKAYDRTENAKRRMSWYPPIGITISTTPDPIKK